MQGKALVKLALNSKCLSSFLVRICIKKFPLNVALAYCEKVLLEASKNKKSLTPSSKEMGKAILLKEQEVGLLQQFFYLSSGFFKSTSDNLSIGTNEEGGGDTIDTIYAASNAIPSFEVGEVVPRKI